MTPRLALLCLLLSALSAFGQSNYAVLSGSVTDPQQRAIVGAKLHLTAQNTGATRDASSNSQGLFELPGLAPDRYEIKIEAQGFAPQTRSLQLEVGQRLTLDFALAMGPVAQSVEVKDVINVLKTNDASVGEVIEAQSIRELPLNGRMLIDLVLTVPGAHAGHGAQMGDMNPLYWRPGQRSSVTIGGNRPNANYFLLDGATNTDPTFNTLNLSPSPDAVQEFKVQTGSYSAEMGGAGGGQVNIVTRSGSNKFHGTVYEFLRNGALDAHSFNDMGSNHLVQNNFGASIGGPIVHNRTFFFVNYEGLRRAKADTMVETVPTAMEAMGDFSMASVDIYNPFSFHDNPNYDPNQPIGPKNPRIIRDQFPGNVIPEELLNPAAVLFLQNRMVRPNVDMNMDDTSGGCAVNMGIPNGNGSGLDCNNYFDNRNEHHVNDQGTVRVDHMFNPGNNLAARYSISSERGFMPQNLPGFGALHDNMSQHGSLSWIRVLSPRLVNTAAVTVSRLSMRHDSENNGKNDIVAELGIQGVGFGGLAAAGAPWFNLQGYSGMGDTFAATPMHAWDTILEARDALSWQLGRHSLRFGGSFRRYIWPMWGFFQNRGYYQFTNGFTTQTATNDGTGSALASFLLGLPVVKQRQAGIPQMQLRQWYLDGFAQDSFRLTTNTNIEMGVRYEYMDPLIDIRYTNSNIVFNDGKPQVFIGGQQGYPKGLMYPNRANFAPRFGLAQNLPRLGIVVHAAYGIFYTPVDMNTWCNQRHNVPFVFPETAQSDNFNPAFFNFDFAPAVLGKTRVSFTTFDPHAAAQYIQQWSLSLGKSLGQATTLEAGYLGSRGFHLQRSHLINNAPPGPGPIQPRRPYQTLSFVDGTILPGNIEVQSSTFPVSGMNLLENTAQSWYDAGYVNVRRRYSHGLSLLTNYTWSKNLSTAPDFRSPMFESPLPQNNSNLDAEKGPACDLRHRFALSAVYDLPALSRWTWAAVATRNWHLSTLYQIQTGFPFTISVFGDTANAGTLLGENPIRANATGQPIFRSQDRTSDHWFNTDAFAAPPAFIFGNVGRNSVYGPGLQTLDLAITERARFQFRGELFNALNHANLGTPGRFVNTPQFGTITEAATPGREIKLSARLSF